jgi:hypothetical protein
VISPWTLYLSNIFKCMPLVFHRSINRTCSRWNLNLHFGLWVCIAKCRNHIKIIILLYHFLSFHFT